jgi:hypothetical protein
MTTPSVKDTEQSSFVVHEGDTDSPAFVSSYYGAMVDTWKMSRELMIGTRAVRDNASARIPKYAAETESDWSVRVSRTEVHPMFKVTVKGLAGLVCRKDVKLRDDVPAEIVSHAENIDGQGTAFPVFCKQLLTDGLQTGIFGVLVDCKPAPVREDGKKLSQEEEAQLGVRPYWVHYTVENILSIRTAVDRAGFLVLRQIVLHECVENPVGDFGYSELHQYRVFRRYLDRPDGEQVTFQLYQLDPNAKGRGKDDIKPVGNEDQVRNVNAIPFAFFYIGERTGPGKALPPLEDLMYTNVAHTQVLSDHRHSLHTASVPILVFIGAKVPKVRDESSGEEAQATIGPTDALEAPKDARIEYVEHSGQALSSSREELKDLEARAATQGLAMLTNETRMAETEEAKKIDKAQQDATLGSAARALEDGIEVCLAFHAQYLKKDTGGSAEVNKDFMNLQMDSGMIAALSSLVAADQLDLETMWDLLINGGILPDDFDKTAVLKKINDLVASRPVLTLPSNGKDNIKDVGSAKGDVGTREAA